MSSRGLARSSIQTAAAASASSFHLAFRRVEAEIRAVTNAQLLPISFDPQSVVRTVLGAYPKIVAHRPELSRLPLEIAVIDKLEDYALALGYSHSRWQQGLQHDEELEALSAHGRELRERLHADAFALAKRGIMNPRLLDRCRHASGYKNIAFDVVGLVESFFDEWDRLEGRTLVSSEELSHAREVANRMIELLGLRQRATERREASVLRQQAYVLCARSYELARGALVFIRRHDGDVDRIAPLLSAGRAGRRPSSASRSETSTRYGASLRARPSATFRRRALLRSRLRSLAYAQPAPPRRC